MRARRVTDRRPRLRGARLVSTCGAGLPTHATLLRRARRRPQMISLDCGRRGRRCAHPGAAQVWCALVAGELVIWTATAERPPLPPDFVRTALRQHPEDLVIAT